MRGHGKSDPESMMAFPGIPGIIEGAMTVTQEPNGRISFRVLVNASGESTGCRDCIELIIDPEYVRQALAAPIICQLDSAQLVNQLPTFPCHIGFKSQ